MAHPMKLILVVCAISAFCSGALAQPSGVPVESMTFGRVLAGPLGDGTRATTEILLTNRDASQLDCGVLVFLNKSTTGGATVQFNGQNLTDGFLEMNIPQGGVRKLVMTANGSLVTGAILIAALSPCTPQSIAGSGRYQLATEDGNLNEFFSIVPNREERWLRNGRCVALSTCFRPSADATGFSNNLGVAFTSVFPNEMAPEDTFLQGRVFDADGNEILPSRGFNMTGQHQAFFPLNSFQNLPGGPLTLILCLNASDPAYKADLTTIQVGTDRTGFPQFDTIDFADGFESGDTSAWKRKK